MKRSYLFGIAVLLFAAAPAFAAEKIDSGETNGALTGPNCDLSGYKTSEVVLSPSFAIPDNGQVQLLAATLPIPNDGGLFTDVIATVTMNHTWVGDLRLQLNYFQNCGDAAPVASTYLLCRQRGTAAAPIAPCGATATGFGAGSDLGTVAAPGVFSFSDDATAAMGDGVNPSSIPSGCYKAGQGLMSVFDGLAKGGCFTLTVADFAGGDTGNIVGLAIHSTNEGPVASKTGTWGALKTLYR